MFYISNCKLKFFLESYLRDSLYILNSAQLQGHFKSEHFCLGQIDIIQKLSNDLNLKIDVDKLKV